MTRCTTILAWAVVLFFTSAASGATLFVHPNGTGDYPTIQDAIDAAIPGDQIVLGDGTFVGARNRDLNFLGKNLTLRSQNGNPAFCTIDCERASRGLSIVQGETAALIQGITIRNGFGPWGGGINLMNATATFQDCLITLCSADDSFGAAIAAGAYALNSTVTFEDCEFIENYFALRGTGAGLFAWESSEVTAIRCRFIGNRAPGISSGGTGGGIRVQDSSLTLVDCEVRGNKADIGAGISCGQLCVVDFRNCLVAGNGNDTLQGSSIAAGIQFGYDTDGSVESCTIVGNRAYSRGAGIYVANECNLIIENSILWGNCIGGGQGESAYLLSLGVVDFVCSDINPATVQGGTVSYTNTFSFDPQFCAPEPCANAPTIAGAYTLDASSPLVDAQGCGLIGSSPVACGATGISLGDRTASRVRIRGIPNPFRRSTLLRYSIRQAGPVDVSLYDIAGRLIFHFDEGPREAGSHTIPWNGRIENGTFVPAGVYIVRISSGGLVAGDRIVRID